MYAMFRLLGIIRLSGPFDSSLSFLYGVGDGVKATFARAPQISVKRINGCKVKILKASKSRTGVRDGS